MAVNMLENKKGKIRIMDKILSTYNHGICLFSVNVMRDFLKREKIRSKRVLDFFQKEDNKYLFSQKEGVWFPLVQINSGEYVIKVEGYDQCFDNEWEQKMEYEGFNIDIRGGLWISDIGSLLTFNEKAFGGVERTFEDGDGELLYSDIKYNIPSGKYLITIKGYTRKQLLDFPNANYGYFFSFTQIKEFEGYKNPREEQYNFNVANMK